jgi:peptidyl-tRNA hydrolase, PTH1 family
MKLIIGLGNPGKEYAANRHNIGFLSVNYLAKKNHISLDKKQGKARVGMGEIDGTPVVLAKPQTYMNLSGVSVIHLLGKYKLSPDDLIVIHDDLDLPLGKIRIKKGSSAGGHNGIKSIIGGLGTQDFIRIRIGISRPQTGSAAEETIVDYVLGDFEGEDKQLIDETIKKVAEAVSCLIKEDVITAMNKFN